MPRPDSDPGPDDPAPRRQPIDPLWTPPPLRLRPSAAAPARRATLIAGVAATAVLAIITLATPEQPPALEYRAGAGIAGGASPAAPADLPAHDEPEPRDRRRQDPAPAEVWQIVEVHGGSAISPWAPAACDWLIPHLRSADLPPWMASVAWRESRCQPHQHNDDASTEDDSYGLFQINAFTEQLRTELRATCGVHDPTELLDARANVACASALYARYGYRPWDAGRYFG